MVLRECTGASPGGPGDLRRAGGHWTISGNCPVRWSARMAGRWRNGLSALLRRRRRSSRRGEASTVHLRLGRRPGPRRSQGLRGGASGQSRQGGRDTVGHRRMLRGCQETGGAGPAREAKMGRLVPAHHAVDAGPCLPGGGAAPRLETGRKGGRYDLNEEFSSLTVSEVRRRLASLVWTESQPYDFILYWSGWIRRHQARAQRCHYRRRLSLLNPVVRR